MLRKTLSFVLVLALALSLVGCGGAASSSTPASISTTSTCISQFYGSPREYVRLSGRGLYGTFP